MDKWTQNSVWIASLIAIVVIIVLIFIQRGVWNEKWWDTKDIKIR